MRTRKSHNNRRSGQIVILFALGIVPVMISLLALVVDVGNVCVVRAELQNSADAAVLAAARVLAEERATGADESSARATAQQEAMVLIGDNGTDNAAVDIQFGRYAGGQFVVMDNASAATAVRARLDRHDGAPGGPVSMFFASLAGLKSVDVSGEAASQVQNNVIGVNPPEPPGDDDDDNTGTPSSGGLAPFAVHENAVPGPGETFTFYPAGNGNGNSGNNGNGNSGNNGNKKNKGNGNNGNGQTQTAPGNWGLVDLNEQPNGQGRSNPTHDLVRWIKYGYDEPFVLNSDGHLWLFGNPGFRAGPIERAVEWRIENQAECVVMLYDEVTGQGQNTQYRVVGFVQVTLLDVNLTGKPRYVTARVNDVVSLPNAIADDGAPESSNIHNVQLTM